MDKVSTLDSMVRLLVVQFHMRKKQIPSAVPAYSDFHKSTRKQICDKNGIQVMRPTPDVLVDLFENSSYQLIDAWHEPDQENWKYETVRYVFCNPENINPAGLRPDFATRRNAILDSLKDLTKKNIWQTMGHLNPYFVGEQETDQKVLMLDCNSRKATVKLVPVEVRVDDDDTNSSIEFIEQPVTVFQGGRDRFTYEGIGPRVLLADKAYRLKLDGNEVVLSDPPELKSTLSVANSEIDLQVQVTM